MLNLVDEEKELSCAYSKRRKHIFLFAFSTIISIVLDIILIITSKDNYVVELIFSILISIAYLLYLVFYFVVIRPCILNEKRFYEGVLNTTLQTEEVELLEVSKENKINNGLEFYVLKANVIGGLKDEEKNFLLPQMIKFKRKEKATLYLYGTTVIRMEEHK